MAEAGLCPVASGCVCDLDAEEAVGVPVAGGGIGIPVLADRLRPEAPVTVREPNRGADRVPVDPDAPTARLAAQLEHGETVALTGLGQRHHSVISRRLPRPGDLVIDLPFSGGKASLPDLKPFITTTRPKTRAANTQPAGDMARLNNRPTKLNHNRAHP
jgi:hypothetical protein